MGNSPTTCGSSTAFAGLIRQGVRLLKRYKIRDDIYLVNIWLVVGDYDDYEKYLKKRFNCDGFEEGIYGIPAMQLTTITHEGEKYYYLWMPTFRFVGNYFVDLAHEINHLCFRVFFRRGVLIDDGNNESFCYYFSYMYRKFIMKLEDLLWDVTNCDEAMDYMKEAANEKY